MKIVSAMQSLSVKCCCFVQTCTVVRESAKFELARPKKEEEEEEEEKEEEENRFWRFGDFMVRYFRDGY